MSLVFLWFSLAAAAVGSTYLLLEKDYFLRLALQRLCAGVCWLWGPSVWRRSGSCRGGAAEATEPMGMKALCRQSLRWCQMRPFKHTGDTVFATR